ncbi:hypothetical protein [Bacillus weihaiensis]|uniref:hypothetical protein n=1 Tax=Bacillus weihaiensis TaxID=1547283 RepID=UPI0023540B6C|nr:hypothetical protein [Bacillus weihaiensis]
MKKHIAVILTVGFWLLIAFYLTGINVPLPSSLVIVVLGINTIFAFFSLFIQRLVIRLYKANVYEKSHSFSDYFYKYIAILTSGINYFVQMVIIRLPLIFNKAMGLVFFVVLLFINYTLLHVFNVK